MGSPALIRGQSRNLNHRPDFDGALVRPWDACRYADGLVEILRIDQEVAAELFAGLRERTVGDQPFAVAHLDAGGRRHRLQRGVARYCPFALSWCASSVDSAKQCCRSASVQACSSV